MLSQIESPDKVFDKHATTSVPDVPEPVMSPTEFVDAVAPPDFNYNKIPRKSFEALFAVADRGNKGYVTRADWRQFDALLDRPDADYEIAFRFFDRAGSGTVSFSDIVRLHAAHASNAALPFDWNTHWASLYWGSPEHRRRLGYQDFSQMLAALPAERVRQGFAYLDRDARGVISPQDFRTLMSSVMAHKLSDKVLANLPRLPEATGDAAVSYAAVRAFLNVVHHSDLVDALVKRASARTMDGRVTKQNLLAEASHSVRFGAFTPLELDLLLFFAALNKDPSARADSYSLDDFRAVIDPGYQDPSTRYVLAEKAKIAAAKNAAQDPKSFLRQVFESVYNFALGSVAGAFGATVVYPIDLVKTRMQNQRATTPGQQLLYKNSWDCFRKVLSREGFRGLYSGLGPQLVGVAPEKAIKLTVNDLVRGKAADASGHITLPAEILGGASAGACQVVFTNPLEIVKIRLQVQGELLRAAPVEGAAVAAAAAAAAPQRKSALTIVRQLGLVGLYKGASACLLRDVPFSAIYFPTYAHLKKDYFGEGPGKSLQIWQLLVAGAVAGMPAAYLTTPCDVVKTRLQVEAKKGQTAYKGLLHCARTVMKEEGPRAFFKGGVARILRSSPQFGCTLAAYELLHTLLPLPDHPKTEAGHYEPSREYVNELQAVGGEAGLKYLRSRSALRLLLDMDYSFGVNGNSKK